MSTIQIQTPPAAEPVTMTVLKSHLRVIITNDDALLAIYLQSARELVESESGRSLVNKLYRQSHDRFPRHGEESTPGIGFSYRAPRYAHHYADTRQAIKLLRSPLVSVLKITYIDTSGVPQTLLPAPEEWQAQTEYEIGSQIVDANGNLQEVTAVTHAETGGASISAATVPVWNLSVGGTTTDGDLTRTNKDLAPAGDFIEDRDSEPPRLMPFFGQVWPLSLRVPNAVQIYFTAGYGNDAADAPATLKCAVMMATGVSYEHREAVTPEVLRQLDWYNRLIMSERVIDWNPTR